MLPRVRIGLMVLVASVVALGACGPRALAGVALQAQDTPTTTDVAGVVVTTDAPTYAPGDAISATVQNNTAGPIAPPGGIVCQGSPWPFSVQLLDDSGNWQDVVYPRTPPCVGIAVRQVGPGESQTRTLNAPSDVGQYRLVYAYTASDGTQGAATSDPFTIAAP